jgi:chitodextrinase
MFKMRAETTSSSQRYSAKFWPQSEPEPTSWDIVLNEPLSATAEGSLLLVAHHIDVSFGDVVVTPLGTPPAPDTTPPSISDVQVSVTDTTATVTWQTDEPASSAVSYGPTSAYEDGTISDPSLVTSHTITLTDLQPESQYFFRVSSVDGSGNSASGTNLSFTTEASPPVDTTAPVISNVQVSSVTTTSAIITWQTDEPADSVVAFGPSSAYENGSVSNSTLVTSHSVTLTNLVAGTQYHFQVRSADGSGNQASGGDLTLTTDSATSPPSGIVSDNFDGALDTTVWAFNDPVGDSSVTTTGTQLAISVPAGTSHDLWRNANDAPRVVQSVADADFEVTVKFDSAVTQKYQLQGIVVEQDNGNLLRFDFYSDGRDTRLFAASFSNGSPNARANFAIAGGVPLYMRIKREGDLWTQSYSFDGINWLDGASFTYALNVTTAGVFAGNAGGSPPAHTALVDYFQVLQ